MSTPAPHARVRATLCAVLLTLASCGERGPAPDKGKSGGDAPAGETAPPSRAHHDLTIAFTAHMAGNLEPCGCTETRWGGLARRAGALEALRARHPALLVLDAGSAARGPLAWEVVNYRAALRGMKMLGVSAANIGRSELLLNAQALRSASRDEGLPLVSLNTTDEAGNAVAPSHIIVEINGLRVLVAGVVQPNQTGSTLRAADPVQAAGAFAPTMSALNADVRILLADADQATLRALAGAAPEFDAIIGGDVPQASQSIERIGPVSVVAAASKAKVMGVLTLPARGSPGAPAEPALRVLTLDNDTPESPALVQLVEDYNSELSRLLQSGGARALGIDPAPLPEGAPAYAGSAQCLDCHATTAAMWTHARHAHAAETLIAINRDANPDCMRCHTVALGRPGGFLSMSQTPHLAGVGCEACHGPSSLHVQEMRARPADAPMGSALVRLRPASEAGCVVCHDPENSPNFDYQVYWPKILHGHEAQY